MQISLEHDRLKADLTAANGKLIATVRWQLPAPVARRTMVCHSGRGLSLLQYTGALPSSCDSTKNASASPPLIVCRTSSS